MAMINKMAKYFPTDNNISEIDLLVEADEKLLVEDITRKMTRDRRREAEKNIKKRNKRIYTRYGEVNNYAHRTLYDRDDRTSITPIFHGAEEPRVFIKCGTRYEYEKVLRKVQNRKARYQRIVEEPEQTIYGDVSVEEIILNRYYQRNSNEFISIDIGTPIRGMVREAWEEYKYALAVEANDELDKILKSIYNLMKINDILNNENLTKTITDLIITYNDQF